MSYLKDREVWLEKTPTGNPPAEYYWKFIQDGVVVVRDSDGVDKKMVDEGNIKTINSESILGSGDLEVGGGVIVEVKQTVKTDTFTTTSSTDFVPITGLEVTVSPPNGVTAENWQVMVTSQFVYSLASGAIPFFKITRNGADIYVGDADGNRRRVVFGGITDVSNARFMTPGFIKFLDTPNTLDPVTYKVECIAHAGTIFINTVVVDSDNVNRGRGASSITAEVIK